MLVPILTGLAGALVGVVVGRLTARTRATTTAETPPTSAKRWLCEGCGKHFSTETDGIYHAMDDHRAPDTENARYIITEVDSETRDHEPTRRAVE